MKTITIATRGSKLALWQAEHIGELLQQQHAVRTELLVLKTKGDIILDVPLAKVGGKGLFVKEIEEALLDGRADIAVHSMKDVPMELPEGLMLGVIPQRASPADIFLSVQYADVHALPPHARVGTSSLRRQAQLLLMRPDLVVESLRGNINTRLRKLMEGQFDAIIMAAAGLDRLGLTAPYMTPLPPDSFLPAAGQGALGLEFAATRHDIQQLLEPFNHQETFDCVTAERGFLAGLDGGCQVPIAAFAHINGPDEMLFLEGLVATPSGETVIRRSIQGERTKAKELGFALAAIVKQAGGDAILQDLYKV